MDKPYDLLIKNIRVVRPHGNAAHECVAEPLPMPGVYVIGDVHSNLAALGGEPSSMPPFDVQQGQVRSNLHQAFAL